MKEELDLLVFGDTAIDQFYEVEGIPEMNNASEVIKFHSFYGGMGANTAVVATNLGLKVGLISVIGSDAEDYLEYMKRRGVRLLFDEVLGDTTRSMFFKVRGGGISFFYKGVTSRMDELKVKEEHIRLSKCVYMARAYLRLQETVSNLCKNKFLVYNPGYGVFKFQEKIPSSFYRILKNTNVLILNEYEVEHLKKMGFKLDLKLGPKVFLITRGAQGCNIYSTEVEIKVPAYKTQVADTSGAGDAFSAGFIAAQLKDFDLYESVRVGNATASFVVEEWGCQKNLPDWEEVLERYKKI